MSTNVSYLEQIGILRKKYEAEIADLKKKYQSQKETLLAELDKVKKKDYSASVKEEVAALYKNYSAFYAEIEKILKKNGKDDFLSSLSTAPYHSTPDGLVRDLEHLAQQTTALCRDFEKDPEEKTGRPRLLSWQPLLVRAKFLFLSITELYENLPSLLKKNTTFEASRREEIALLNGKLKENEEEEKTACLTENLSLYHEIERMREELNAFSSAPSVRLAAGKFSFDSTFCYPIGFLTQKTDPKDIAFLQDVVHADTAFLASAPLFFEPEKGKHNILVNLHEKDFCSGACKDLILSLYLSVASRLPGNSLRFGAFLCDTNASYKDLSFLYEKVEQLGSTSNGKEGEYVSFPLAKESGRFIDLIDRLEGNAYRAETQNYFAFNRRATGDLMPAYLTYYYKYPHAFGEIRDCASKMLNQIAVGNAGYYNVIFQDVDANFDGYAKRLEAGDIDAILIDMTNLHDIRVDGKGVSLDIFDPSFNADSFFTALNEYYTKKQSFLLRDFFQTSKKENAPSLFRGGSKLSIPLGMEENRLFSMEFNLAQPCHSIFLGKSGSGKTSILHSFILSIMHTYSPKEVAIYLADYKGTEFECYRENAPHVRFLQCRNGKKNDNETTFYSMFQSIKKIDEERSILIRQKGVTDFLQYNAKVSENEKLPFIFFIVDEYNSLLDNFKPKYGNKLLNLINTLTSLVRSSGIAVMLSGQQLADNLNLDNIKYKFVVSDDSAPLSLFNAKGEKKAELSQFLSIPQEGRVLIGTGGDSIPAKVKVPYCGDHAAKQAFLLDICLQYRIKETHTVIGGDSTPFGVSQYTEPAYRTMADPVMKKNYIVSPDELDYDPYDTTSFPVYIGVSSTDTKPVSLEFSSNPGSFGYSFFSKNTDRMCAMLRSACFSFVYKTGLLKYAYMHPRIFYFGKSTVMNKTVGVYFKPFPFLKSAIDCIDVETEGGRAIRAIKFLNDLIEERAASDASSLPPYLVVFDGLDFFQRPGVLEHMISAKPKQEASFDERTITNRMEEMREKYQELDIPFTEETLRADAVNDLKMEHGEQTKTADLSSLTAVSIRGFIKNIFNYGSVARVFSIVATSIGKSLDDFIHSSEHENDYANFAVFGTMEETVSLYGNDRRDDKGDEISTCIVDPSEIKTRLYAYSHIHDISFWESLKKML